jgi:hypothetical protein
LQMLCTPWNIGSLSSLFVCSDMMNCELNNSKVPFESLYKFVSLRLRTFFVRLHCQKNQIVGFCSFVCCEHFQSFREQFDILFVVRNNKTVVNLFS